MLLLGVVNFLMVASRVQMLESPRFLLMSGDEVKARKVLSTVARTNGVELPDNIELINDEAGSDSSSSEVLIGGRRSQTAKKLSAFIDVVKPPLTMVTIALWVIWFASNYAFTSFNAFLPKMLILKEQDHPELAGGGTTEVYRDTFIYAAAGVPGSLLGAYLVESRLGRRFTMFFATVVSGLCMFLFRSVTSKAELIGFSSGVSFFAQIMYASIYTYTPEVYPTKFRTTAVGICSGISRFAGVLAPILTGIVIKASLNAVLYLSAVLMGLAAAAMLLLRIETRGRNLT